MKILEVNKLYYPWRGGVEEVAQNIAEWLSDEETQVDVLVCQPKGAGAIEKINEINVYKAASFGMLLRMPISFDFLRLYKKMTTDYDVIFLHHPFPLGFLAATLFNRYKKIVVWYHADIVKQRIAKFLLTPIFNVVFKRADKIFVASNNIIKNSTVLGKYKDKCVVIPLAIDLEKFKKTATVVENANKIKNQYGNPLVLAHGRLIYYKGFEYLIEAMTMINKGALVIFGDGPDKLKLENLIKKYNLEKRVFIVGGDDEAKFAFYEACDVFVFPSVAPTEAFGVVQIEAMAFGKPIINTNLATGVPEVSLDRETGLTVEPKNVKQLAEAINKILSNDEMRKKFGQAARKRVETYLSKDKFCEKLKNELVNL